MPRMFPDSLLPNLLIFLVGQAAVVGLLRTGLVAHGVALVLATWGLADAALVARLVFDVDGAGFVALLVVLQVLSIGAAGLFVWGRWRRRRPDVVAAREETFRAAIRHFVRDEHDDAVRLLSGLCRRDPWDLPSRLARAQVEAAAGRVARARSALRSARSLEGSERYADLITGELQALERRVVEDGDATREVPTELPRPADDARRTRVVDRGGRERRSSAPLG